MSSKLDLRVLGPLRVSVDGVPVGVSAAKQRALLAALILNAGKTLMVEKLADVLWDERPPHNARGAIHAYVMRLRRALNCGGIDQLILTMPGGYLLDVDEDATDVARFRRLARQAERAAAASDVEAASRQLGEALKLWRGPPLEDVDSDSLRRNEAAQLTEQRLFVTERRIELELALGHHRDVISELNALVELYPLRERYWHLLMLALYQSGWRADALAAYRRARRLFIAELGIEPGDELRDLHDAMLADRPVSSVGDRRWAWRASAGPIAGPADTSADAGSDDAGSEVSRRRWPGSARPANHAGDDLAARPAARHCRIPGRVESPAGTGQDYARIRQCQLPRDVSDFVGRGEVSDMIVTDLSGSQPISPVVVLTGPPGVGKTALAVRVAHRVRGQFPDGQLYLRLESRGDPARTGVILADLMLAAGRSRGSIPDGLDQRAAAFRAWLADKNVLLVIDNVADATAVRPLLPGTPGSAAILTSRHDLRALTVLDGARHYTLGVLQPTEALELLDRALGSRAAAESAAAAELAALCGYLPLALRIAAVSLSGKPGMRLGNYTARLRLHGHLSGLGAGDGPKAVEAVFGTPYNLLDPALRGLLRLLAEQHFSPSDVAAMLGTRTADATRLLDELAGVTSMDQSAANEHPLPLRSVSPLAPQIAAQRHHVSCSVCDRHLACAGGTERGGERTGAVPGIRRLVCPAGRLRDRRRWHPRLPGGGHPAAQQPGRDNRPDGEPGQGAHAREQALRYRGHLRHVAA